MKHVCMGNMSNQQNHAIRTAASSPLSSDAEPRSQPVSPLLSPGNPAAPISPSEEAIAGRWSIVTDSNGIVTSTARPSPSGEDPLVVC
jgi:hypothetical protein